MIQQGNLARTAIAALSLSAAGFVGILLSEGYVGDAMRPLPGDVPTIGFGTTEGVKPGDKTTPTKALSRALTDIHKFEGAIKRCVTVPLHQHEYEAYTALAYNIGAKAFCSSTLVRKLNQQDYVGACAEILRWNRFKSKPNKGLTNRRQAEFAQCKGESNG